MSPTLKKKAPRKNARKRAARKPALSAGQLEQLAGRLEQRAEVAELRGGHEEARVLREVCAELRGEQEPREAGE